MHTKKTGHLANTLDGYSVVRPIGAGGMAEVWLVRHDTEQTLHALKILSIRGRAIRQRLLQEGRLQSGIQHPNVVSVTEVVELSDGTPALLMDFIAGAPLDAIIAYRHLKVAHVDLLARQMMQGVAAAHAAGAIHRDLKPENVLLHIDAETVRPMITDFGLAKALKDHRDTQTRSGISLGTPRHMAPEQFRDAKRVDKRSDIFSLGTILYEMLCGQSTFPEGDFITTYEKAATADYTPLDDLMELPARMVRAIDAALQPDREARPPTIEALLEIWTAGTPAPTDAFTPADRIRLEAIARTFRHTPDRKAANPTDVSPRNLSDRSVDSDLWSVPSAELISLDTDTSGAKTSPNGGHRWATPSVVALLLLASALFTGAGLAGLTPVVASAFAEVGD